MLIPNSTQVSSYSKKGLSAAYVCEDTSKEMKDDVRRGKCQLVYITPELLVCHAGWRRMLATECYIRRLMAFVVDEAHTVKKW